MSIYIAIGHFKDNSNITHIALSQRTMKDFRTDCYGNAFVPYVILTEAKYESIKADIETEWHRSYEQVKKLTSNYRKWNIVAEYLDSCTTYIDDSIAHAKK